MVKVIAKIALLPEGWHHDVEVDIAPDGTISAVRTDVGKPDHNDSILLAAPANLHSHTFQRAMAAMSENRIDGHDSFWTWRQVMYRFLEHLTPEMIEAIAAMAFVEMQEAGFASVGEFHYLHHQSGGAPYANIAETSERIFAAAAETGIGLTHLPVLYSFGGADGRPLAGGQQRFGNDIEQFERLVEAARTVAGDLLPGDTKIGVAPHSLRAVSVEQLKLLIDGFSDVPIHMHIAEQQKEVDEVVLNLGRRPVEWLLGEFDIGRNWCLIHATQMNRSETRALARSGAVAGLCPITEANLGDGIFNAAEYIAAGGALGIGTDSNIEITLAGELKMLEYSQRLCDRARVISIERPGSVGQALYLRALRGGVQALGRNAGEISVGKLADLVVLDGDHVTFAALENEQICDGWIFATGCHVVRELWSAGRHCVTGGRHVARDAVAAKYRATMKLLKELM